MYTHTHTHTQVRNAELIRRLKSGRALASSVSYTLLAKFGLSKSRSSDSLDTMLQLQGITSPREASSPAPVPPVSPHPRHSPPSPPPLSHGQLPSFYALADRASASTTSLSTYHCHDDVFTAVRDAEAGAQGVGVVGAQGVAGDEAAGGLASPRLPVKVVSILRRSRSEESILS